MKVERFILFIDLEKMIIINDDLMWLVLVIFINFCK